MKKIGLLPKLILGIISGIIIGFVAPGIADLGKQAGKTLMAKTVKYVLIPLIPIHVAGVFAKLSASGQIFQTIAAFASVFALIIILQLSYVVIQYCIAWAVSGKKPIQAIRDMLPAYFTALGTQSSAATIHLAGDTITLVLASMGVMLLFGQTPTLALMAPLIFMLGIAMVAAAGIPGGGVMTASVRQPMSPATALLPSLSIRFSGKS